MARVALFGLPASGKGTLASSIVSRWGWPQLSTGDMIRRMRSEPGAIGDELRALPPGSFASDELIVAAVRSEIQNVTYARGVIFDGFPRTLGQLAAMDEAGMGFDAVLLLGAKEDALVERSVNRRVHIPSGRLYNLKSKPPKVEGLDDETGEPLTWREDDHEAVIRKRFLDYWTKTDPVVQELRSRADKGAFSFVEIDAMGSAEQSWEAARGALESLGVVKKSKPA